MSRKEQKRRFLERLDNTVKKLEILGERCARTRTLERLPDRLRGYDPNTATDDAPWYVVPADNKWFTQIVVAAAIVDAMSSRDLSYPKVNTSQRSELASAKKALMAVTRPSFS